METGLYKNSHGLLVEVLAVRDVYIEELDRFMEVAAYRFTDSGNVFMRDVVLTKGWKKVEG